ncbi:NAD(P)/FAD-dependent oxidoreductase [Nocardioides bigeumensis]|uniref:NAD(P)/FAD-dependent oxidoreductase n=1 Tax=Nocardioides bigeumensis TaxID=433657 RepID=A0ABN2YQE0_9ACTN
MSTQHIETIVIGAGQAGLSTGYHLKRLGRSFVILDGAARVGDQWRQQWDTLRLYSPAGYDGLPGLPFPAARWSFPGKDEVAAYVEQYAAHHELPVRLGVRVEALDGRPDGGYAVRTSAGEWTCDNVVVATGTFGRTPAIPDFAAELDPRIVQLHSSEYRRPGQLPEGRVLVVGASHSGTDIAYDVAQTHPTTLCGRDCGEIPVDFDSWIGHRVFPLIVFAWRHVLTRRTPMGRKEMGHVRKHGGPMIRVKRKHLAERGVERLTDRATGVVEGRQVVGDDALDVATVVWATGFKQQFGWIHLPVIGEDGWPVEYRGVVDAAPGLYFCGLSFQYAFSSMVFPGVGRDAAYVAEHLDHRMRTASPRRADRSTPSVRSGS